MTTKHLTPKDLAERMGVPVRTVYKWNTEGTGPEYFPVGRHVRYRLADVEKWERARLKGGAA
jgi:excisionase family DNA binding protein